MKRSDLVMVEQAIRQRWPIPPDVKQTLIDRLSGVIANSPDDRAVARAAGILVACESQNQKDDKTNLAHADRTRFLAIAERLGLSGVLGVEATARTSCDPPTVDGTVVRTRQRRSKKKG